MYTRHSTFRERRGPVGPKAADRSAARAKRRHDLRLRAPAEAAIRAVRESGVRGVCALFDEAG
jgi:hypothetical protein